MGVRGLQTFIENNGHAKVVHIEEEIRMWKRRNPNQQPIIVFDILGLCFMDKGLLCGGSSSDFDDRMEKFFVRLTQNGVKLVFIEDLAIEIAREDLWIERRNNKFQVCLEIYEKIEMKKPAMDIVSEMSRSRTGWKLSPNAASIASKHGEYRFARFGRDCDFEVADYATKHNAMAVFSADSDFLIFEGNWKFWNFNNLNFENFTAIEYDRLTISRLLAITFQQRPLFATLIGNDFSKQCQDELNQFHRRLGSPHDKFRNVANFIRREFRRIDLSEDDIDFIVTEVFGSHAGDDKWQLIQDSLNSYDLHSQIDENPENDPIETRLISFGVKPIKNYRKMNINSIQMVSISFNDMATVECSTVLVGFLVDLIRKRIAIINNNVATNGEKTFKILKKMSREEKFAAYHESPIAPDCPMPDLIELLTNDDSNEELNEIRWTLLAWMLSISDEHRDVLRSMDREFRVSCATLLALVQRKILSVKAADGILITEMAVKKNQMLGMKILEYLEACYVRAAHIYRTVHSDINYVFITAGLITSTSDLFRFDGVYFQNLMAVKTFPKDLFEEIKPYRIYMN